MRRPAIATTLALATATATGATPHLPDHPYQARFIERPCTEVIALIDSPDPETLDAIATWAANIGMTFGILLGYELAHPGIRGDHETILTRLRRDCAATPDRPALDLLRSYHAE